MLSVDEFLGIVGDKSKVGQDTKFGSIDPDYASGRPKILFDGVTTVSTKTFPYLSSYIPTANDRVIIFKNVVLGKII